LMNLLTQPDRRDFMNLPHDPVDYAASLERDVKGLRIGLLLDIGSGTRPTQEVSEAVSAAARLLEAHGATIEPLAPFLDDGLMECLNRFFQARAWTDLSAMPAERQEKVLPFIRDWCRPAAGYSAADAFRAIAGIFQMRERTIAATGAFDFVLSPTSPIVAYGAEEACPGNDPARPFEHICFTAPFNQSEQPAASIGCGMSADGLPIGLQIVGQRFDDLGVLRLSRAYERLRGPIAPWPEP
ncbi:MAG: amidase, partial [Alphaproteobacteria bacterium]|nr:amidase [Alphaproteobacteria bacterium]